MKHKLGRAGRGLAAVFLFLTFVFASFGPADSTSASSSGASETVTVRVPDTSGLFLVDLAVNGAGEDGGGQHAGWRTTYSAHNTLTFRYTAPADTVMRLTDQYGNVLAEWTVDEALNETEATVDFTLQNGIGNYILTLTATNSSGQAKSATIRVKYLALDGGDPCRDDPGGCNGGDGTTTSPDAPNTGLKYVYIGGYALPTYWLVVLLGIVLAGAGWFYLIKQKKKEAVAHGAESEK